MLIMLAAWVGVSCLLSAAVALVMAIAVLLTKHAQRGTIAVSSAGMMLVDGVWGACLLDIIPCTYESDLPFIPEWAAGMLLVVFTGYFALHSVKRISKNENVFD